MSHHARHSPSRAKRDLVCAAAASREALLTPSPSGKAAAWGTDSHWILEQALLTDTPCTHINVPAEAPHDEFDPSDWDEKQRRAQFAFAYAQRVKAQAGGPVSISAEERVYPGRWLGIFDDMDGSVDITIITASMLEIVDYKSGRMHVPATDPQLKLYALGMVLEYYVEGQPLPFTTIRCTIVQPNGSDPEAVRSVDYTFQELYAWLTDVYSPALAASNGPDPVATPSEEGCRWCECSKQNTCRELATTALHQITQVEQPIDSTPYLPEIGGLSDSELCKVLDAVPLFEGWIKNVTEHIFNRLNDGGTLPGYKLVRKRVGRATWTEKDDKKLRSKLKNKKLPIDVYAPRTVLSPAQLLKALADQPDKLASVKLLTHRPEGGLKLAPDSSSSPAIVPGSGAAFGITDLDETASTETPAQPTQSAAFSCLE